MSDIKDFKIKNGVLEKYTGSDTDIIVPDLVATIGDFAFSNNNKIESVMMPNYLVAIGFRAFYDCANLKKVCFNEGLRVIDEDAFLYCNSLEELVFPESLVSIKEMAFAYCSNLKKVTVKGTTYPHANSFLDSDKQAEWVFYDGYTRENFFISSTHTTVIDKNSNTPPSTSAVAGKRFVVTGDLVRFPESTPYPKREGIKALLESYGAKLTGSVSGKTDYLICNDQSVSSTKLGQAREKNITIITESALYALLGEGETAMNSNVSTISNDYLLDAFPELKIYDRNSQSYKSAKSIVKSTIHLKDGKTLCSKDHLCIILAEYQKIWDSSSEMVKLNGGSKTINILKKPYELKRSKTADSLMAMLDYNELIEFLKHGIISNLYRKFILPFVVIANEEDIEWLVGLTDSLFKIGHAREKYQSDNCLAALFLSGTRAAAYRVMNTNLFADYLDMHPEIVTKYNGFEIIYDILAKYRVVNKDVVIPNEIRTIAPYVFYKKKNINSITILATITSIEFCALSSLKPYCDIIMYSNADTKQAFKSNERMSIYFPNKTIQEVPKELKRAALIGFIRHYDNQSEDITKTYITYLKHQRKKLYELIIQFPEIFRFMLDKKVIPVEDIDAVLKIIKNNVEMVASLLEYKNNNFTLDDELRAMNKELNKY